MVGLRLQSRGSLVIGLLFLALIVYCFSVRVYDWWNGYADFF